MSNLTLPAAPAKATPKSVLWKRLFAIAWQFRFATLGVVWLQLILTLLQVSTLGLAGIGIDFLRHAADPQTPVPSSIWTNWFPGNWSMFQSVIAIATMVLITGVLQAVLKFATALAMANLSQKVLIDLRARVYAKLQQLSASFYGRASSSSLINRAAGDVSSVRGFVDGVVVRLLIVTLSLAVSLAYMLSVHVPLTIVCLATTPVLWVGAVQFSRRMQPEYRKSSQLGDRLTETLVEGVQGIQVVKGFGREDDQRARFAKANQNVLDQKLGIFWSISVYQPIMGFLTQVNMLLLIGYGGYLVVQGEIALGSGLFVMANLVQLFANEVGQIINIAGTMQAALVAAERVFEVLDTPVEIVNRNDARSLSDIRGEIEWREVCFSYLPNKPVLSHFNLKIAAGERVGIVGPAGAGKTTLLGLLTRFYDPDSGSVLIDGVDVRDVKIGELRKLIGVVFQESFLFSNTVADNVAFGRLGATDKEVQSYAEVASASEFIDALPERYDTVVGERGANLSGGQRQRLAIARALALEPKIVVLDDATSAIDSQTEQEIHDAIENASRGRTSLIVSNRVRVLQAADRVVVIENGEVAQSGAPSELLQQSGYYRQLALLQGYIAS